MEWLYSYKINRYEKRGIALVSNGVLRIKFVAQNYALKPTLNHILATLKKHVAIDTPGDVDHGDWQSMDDATFNQVVHDLIRDGSKMKAIRMLRSRQGMTMTEAHNFVDELYEQINQ